MASTKKIILIFFFALFSLTSFAYAETLRESGYTGSTDDWNTTSDTVRSSQPFDTTSVYELSSVRLKVSDNGSPGTVNVYLYADSGGSPTGAALSSGSFDCEGTSNTIQTVTMSAYTVTDATRYHLVSGFSTGDGCKIQGQVSSGLTPIAMRYAGSWANMQPDQLYWAIYGNDAGGGGGDPEPSATTTSTAVDSVDVAYLVVIAIILLVGGVIYLAFKFKE